MSSPASLGAIILTGGASRRMGEDKAALPWLGRRAVDRVVDLALALGASPIVSVGPTALGVVQVIEDHAFGGPVGGVLAGARALAAAGVERALVLAVDAPTVRPSDLAALIGADAPGAAYCGLHLPMVLALSALPADAKADWPLGRLAQAAGLARLPCDTAAARRLRGANTPAERAELLAELAERARD